MDNGRREGKGDEGREKGLCFSYEFVTAVMCVSGRRQGQRTGGREPGSGRYQY